MNKHFVDPKTMSISSFIADIELLHKMTSEHFNLDSPRMANGITETFASLLDKECLSQESSSISDVYADLARYTQGILKWNHPGAMINVTPPPSVPSTAAASYLSLFNPNGAQDMSSGHLLVTELAVVKFLAELAGFDPKRAGGVFTFGGKSTNLHAVKHGIQRIEPEAAKHGVSGDIVIVSSKQGHPCHSEVCGWLGIGETKSLRVGTDSRGVVDLGLLEATLDSALSKGLKIATIFANGGTTIQMAIDPISQIAALRNQMVEKYELPYTPRVHVDSVIGWIFLFFKTYDFVKNDLDLHPRVLEKIARQVTRIRDISYADSFGVDFHKTGFCSYTSSVYIAASRGEIYQQGGIEDPDHPIGGGGKFATPYDEVRFGNHSPFQYTLELSRALSGPVEAYVNLKLFGITGYQKLVGELFDATEHFRQQLAATGRFEMVSDDDSDGFATLFVAHPTVGFRSFFDLGEDDRASFEELGLYNYRFYLYCFERQELGRCRVAFDYSSGYHSFRSGSKIGVQKAYPVSPFFTRIEAVLMADELTALLHEFDGQQDTFVLRTSPHQPRPMIFR
ncbi:pyridoxal phosphate-dependent decarboxylase family protein [Nocardia sp. CA-128927]|uniref:pyridoxal phosphate-dependent decarboxylase family protein n=1 Tax=Nocardia sp. CA-128927 TaxID=3239975 RepID=UPI003D991D71